MIITPVPHGLDLLVSDLVRSPGLHMRLEEKFWARIVAMPSGCWEWQGPLNKAGYAQIASGVFLHRWAYTHFIGPIPSRATLDHLCRNRRCGNPTHLEPVTQRENILRGVGPSAVNAHKTHCINGHALTDENIWIRYQRGRVHPIRVCRECGRTRWRKWSPKRKTV